MTYPNSRFSLRKGCSTSERGRRQALGPHRCLRLIRHRPRTIRVQLPPLARTPGHPPFHFQTQVFLPPMHPLIPGAAPHDRLAPVQQIVGLRNVMHVGRRHAHAVANARLRVHPDGALSSQSTTGSPSWLGAHWVPLPSPVLGGRGRLDDGGLHDGSLPQLQSLGFRVGVDFLQKSLTQAVLFQEVGEVEDGGLVGQGTWEFQATEPPDRVGLVDQVFHAGTAEVVEKLDAVG